MPFSTIFFLLGTDFKVELEATNLALQNRLDIIDRKSHLSESTLKKLTRERDMAVSQLGVAYLESQDSKNENEKLRRENAELRTQLLKFTSVEQRSRDDTSRSEQTAATEEGDADDSQIHTQRSSNVSRNTKDLTPSRSTRSRSKPMRDEDTRNKVSNQVDKEISRLEKERAEEALFSIDFPRSARASRQEKSGRADSRKQSNTGKQRVKRVVVEEVDVTDPADTATEEVTRQTRKSSQEEQDFTLLSFVDVSSTATIPYSLLARFLPLNFYRNVKSPNCAKRWKRSDWHASNGWRILKTTTPRRKPGMKHRTLPVKMVRSLCRASRR